MSEPTKEDYALTHRVLRDVTNASCAVRDKGVSAMGDAANDVLAQAFADLRERAERAEAELLRRDNERVAWCSKCGKTETGVELSEVCLCGYMRLILGKAASAAHLAQGGSIYEPR